MRVTVVGAGPAGSLLAWRLASDGARVTLVDNSHPREKPCGGGLTGRALELLPPSPPGDPLPMRRVERCRFDSGDGVQLELEVPGAVGIAARRDLDAWLLRRAVEAGAAHVAERAVEVDPGLGTVRTGAGRTLEADVVAGADGAGSLVRRSVLGPLPRERLTMAAGWYAPGDAEMAIRFTPGLAGYVWTFPRPDHVGVGICAPLGALPSRELLGRLEAEVARAFPALLDLDGERYAHLIPSPGTGEETILEAARGRVALVGDAAALADPITGEGLHSAMRSALLLADTLREDGSPAGYPGRLLEGLGRDLLKAARLRDRFYAPGFAARMLRYSRRSAAIREVLADLVLGKQGYLDLKARLLRSGPRFLLESARSIVAG